MKTLHIGGCDKFLPPLIELIKEEFDFNQHEFLLHSGMGKAPDYPNVKVYERKIIERLKFYIFALLKMHRADKVILHGLFDIKLVFILFFTPWLLRKCYWVMWGGDLYTHKLSEKNRKWKVKEFFRRTVIKNMGNLVTYIKGDVELARKWYGAKGQYHECIMYTSNLYKEYSVPSKQGTAINIQVGNSADPSNNHLEALEKLLPFKSLDLCIYVPLSYGDKKHAQAVIQQGQQWFGDKFKPLTEFMPFDKYLSLLGTIDIAIFNHKRQQAMGNTITLLGLGKTVYIRNDVSQWQFFKNKNIVVGDVQKLSNLDALNIENNQAKVKEYFSKEKLIEQLERLYQ
ncbi:TDP-N-acetylfucosamine:lipid II N-acetylfucosaminyltransferase [Thiopseudomonas alkaliphila]|uniref:TDP-N-acetylfucosamine:lipid II N-acetylfucosaminyltransferase n=1 Tax=Thiopseudomonas alkaliphila TaxID=1697053 RepID=UPI002574FFCF|nr:TDP-N-acetylfucosamine:lipid II N-acetylfucosaminyltransferase [Thiopseudomonas alkaliphila]MDM1706956.1 TDP-N-acetylfucosamine:lipid II N-acetylfucosaminyltransferase [Thiopseudomonas alkaliphila]